MAKILYGAPVREILKQELRAMIKKLQIKPVLVIVQVGDRPDSNVYIKNKINFGQEIGVDVLVEKFEESVTEAVLTEKVRHLTEDKNIHGMIVQLPLPQNIDSEKIINLIPKNKDADGLSGIDEVNSSNIVTPATARAVLAILDYYQIAIKDKKVAIIGRSKLAGGPVAQVLSGRGGKVTVCHRGTQDIATVCRGSDILISAAGQAGLVTRDFVNEKQVVVDVGINRATSPTLPPWGRVSGNPSPLERGGGEVLKPKIVGDVAFSEVEPIVASITPVPGGVGPLTVACLFANLLDLVKTP